MRNVLWTNGSHRNVEGSGAVLFQGSLHFRHTDLAHAIVSPLAYMAILAREEELVSLWYVYRSFVGEVETRSRCDFRERRRRAQHLEESLVKYLEERWRRRSGVKCGLERRRAKCPVLPYHRE